MPAQRHGHRIEALAGGLLCFGGYARDGADRGCHATLWLGPDSGAWEPRADMPCPRAFHSSTTFEGRAWAIGDGLASFDVETDCWREWLPSGSLPASHFGAARVESEVFVLGGQALQRGSMYRVDLRNPEIDEVPAPPGSAPGDHFPFLVCLDGRLHVIGGVDGEVRPTNRHFVRADGAWLPMPVPPEGLWAKFACQTVIGTSAYLFGDFGGHRFDALPGQWTTLPPMPRVLVLPQTAVIGDQIHVLGGMELDGEGSVVHMVFDVRTSTWLDSTPARADCATPRRAANAHFNPYRSSFL